MLIEGQQCPETQGSKKAQRILITEAAVDATWGFYSPPPKSSFLDSCFQLTLRRLAKTVMTVACKLLSPLTSHAVAWTRAVS